MKDHRIQKSPQPLRHKIIYTPEEKRNIALWAVFCGCLVGVFFFMTWYMYNPKSRLAHNLKYGQRYLAAADYSRAEMEFNRVLQMDAENAQAYQGLMQAALGTENTDEAVLLYKKASQALSEYKDPLLRLLEMRAVERTDKGDFDGAFSVATTVEKTTGDRNAAALIRALVIDGMLEQAKKLKGDEALEMYRRILKIDNVDVAAIYERMARIRMEEEAVEEAVALLDEGYEATGEESLKTLRDEYVREHASVFLPDSFVHDLNEALGTGDFEAAARIVRNDLFMLRIAEFAGQVDANGEQPYDFTAIQPADMNMSMFGEYDAGQFRLLILDWQRMTNREAAFNELVYVIDTGEILALSRSQRVSDVNTLVDEGGTWRITTDGRQEMPEETYYTELKAAYAGGNTAGITFEDEVIVEDGQDSETAA